MLEFVNFYLIPGLILGSIYALGAIGVSLLFGILLAGTVVIETVFDWPGIGQYAYSSILQSDYNAIMGFTVWTGVMFILVNLLVDIVHGAIDPREARS